MGGRLQEFLGSWAQITSDRWVLETIECGYALTSRGPPVGHADVANAHPSDPHKRRALEGEISSLLLKQAVRVVTGFMSTFFLVPKKEADTWQPILNLKPLKRFISPKRFRMETLRAILESLDTPAWGASLDLWDAYLHVTIRAEHRKFLHCPPNENV